MAGALLSVVPAAATTILARDFPSLCREADVIFVGTVRAVRSQWVDSAQRSIETLVTFADLTPLLGVGGHEITLRFAGGQVGNMREELAGLPRFAVGERAVVFARNARAISPIVGFNQGCFRVAEGPSGALVLDVGHRPVTQAIDAAVGTAAGVAVPTSLPLDVLLDRIRRELATRPVPP